VPADAQHHPPPLPFVLAVGFAGDGRSGVPIEGATQLGDRLHSILTEIKLQAAGLHRANRAFFSDAHTRLILHCSLASAIDRMAAEIALDLGFELHLILRFDRDGLRPQSEARERFDALVAAASQVLELPGGEDALGPSSMAGLAIVAQSDVLITVSQVAKVVSFGIEMARPVIHISASGSGTSLQWAAFDPSFVTGEHDPATIRQYDADELGKVLMLLLAPPDDLRERQFIRDFQKERRRRWRLRIEYPLLLAAAGVSRIKRRHVRTDRSVLETENEWTRYRDACFQAAAVSVPLDTLRGWYEWADSLAGHFAQSYRSGHVFNFVLGALAVLLGVSNLVLPEWSVWLETALFLVVLAILANTIAGNRQQWHRRWLDYRQLAERLRSMRTLKLLGIAAPDPPGTAADPVARRWVEWYAARAWRAIGAPSGRIDAARLHQLTAAIVDHEIAPQVAYHHSAARQIQRLDRRLEIISFSAFVLALCSSIVLLTGFAIAPAWVHAHYDWFTVLAAGLPAIGTAAVGIRVQGDHAGSAARSERSAVVLAQIAERLRGEKDSLKRAADLTEQAARAMLSDLDEWQLLNQQHDLSVG